VNPKVNPTDIRPPKPGPNETTIRDEKDQQLTVQEAIAKLRDLAERDQMKSDENDKTYVTTYQPPTPPFRPTR